jgi:N-carbamoyl-L-amino-acid hydrolase
MVGRLDEVFRDPADIVKFTVGLFTVAPNAPSVVPSRVHFSVDVRHPDNETLDRLGNLVQPMCEAHKGPCAVEIKEIARARSIEFPQAVRDRIRAVSASLGIPHMDIYSAAGHDARQLHYICPTGMIFVPCKDGISHNEQESALPDDLVAGTQVLAEVLADLAGQP